MNDTHENNNPYDLCIYRDEAECSTCSLREKLDCHFSLKKLLRFACSFMFIVIAGSVGLIVNGYMREFYIFLGSGVIFSIIFFYFWEIRILCSHCPFYAEKGKVLHCYVNYGSLKVWKYHPEPMTISEKIQLIIGFLILFAILFLPPTLLILHGRYLWAIPPVIGFVIWCYILLNHHCRFCLNFSCPFNTQPPEVVDEFLKHNPVMQKAWEKNSQKNLSL